MQVVVITHNHKIINILNNNNQDINSYLRYNPDMVIKLITPITQGDYHIIIYLLEKNENENDDPFIVNS